MDGRQVKHGWNSEVMNEEWDHQFLRKVSIYLEGSGWILAYAWNERGYSR